MGQSPNGSTYSETPCDYILVQGNADLKDGWVVPRIWTSQITKTAKSGDLIMSVRAPAGAIGKTAYDVVIGRGVASINGNEFIYQTLKKYEIEGYWKKIATGSTFESINSEDINDTILFVPIDDSEQKQIGSLFSKLDHLITLHQRQCENLKKLKKFMLQKMFPQNGENVPEIRFSNFTDTWEQRKLGEYVSITSGEAPSKFDKGTELYVKVDDLNYNDKYVVDTQNKVAEHSTVKRVTKGSVVFPKRGAAIMTNKVRIMGVDSYMDTNMMALTSEKLDSEFLYNIISKEGLYKIADTSTIPQINNKHVEPYEVTIPSLAEQRRIGAYFKQLDHLITLHQSKCDNLKELKKYMLQNMFI